MNKLKIVFVGAFSHPKDGSTGGQLFACLSLLDSNISENVDWIKIDSRQESVPLPTLWFRGLKALSRIMLFIRAVIFERADAALIFSASGFSLYEKGLMTCLARCVGVPVIFAPRGSGIGRAKGLQRRLARFLLRRAQIILCQSSQWQAFYYELTDFPKERVVVVPNWIDTTAYQVLKIPPERPEIQVLYLGWMVKLKGIYDLLEAVSAGGEAFSHTRFVMCGGGEELSPFREKVLALGLSDRFDVRGWVEGEAKMTAFEDADIFVLPSYGEGMPNSVLEAMVAGKAVIATRVGGIPDMVSHNIDGLLYEPKDVDGLVHCLICLVQNQQKRLEFGQKARAKALVSHDINLVWPKVLAVFRAAIDSY